MVADQFTLVLNEFALLHKSFEGFLDTGFLVLARMLGFVMVAPIFGRKDVPFPVKMGLAFTLTLMLIWTLPANPAKTGLISSENVHAYTLQILMNVTIGLMIGFIGAMIMEAVNAAGSYMNNQIGLSSAMIFDPSSRQQVALTEKLFGYIGLMVFFHVGGCYWLLSALNRSFQVFPIQAFQHDLINQISFDYLIQISGNTLSIGLQFVAPIFIVTMAVDLILGIINRMAQQIQIFQLSFALKPCIGFAVFLAMLPIFIKLLENYFHDHAAIF